MFHAPLSLAVLSGKSYCSNRLKRIKPFSRRAASSNVKSNEEAIKLPRLWHSTRFPRCPCYAWKLKCAGLGVHVFTDQKNRTDEEQETFSSGYPDTLWATIMRIKRPNAFIVLGCETNLFRLSTCQRRDSLPRINYTLKFNSKDPNLYTYNR